MISKRESPKYFYSVHGLSIESNEEISALTSTAPTTDTTLKIHFRFDHPHLAPKNNLVSTEHFISLSVKDVGEYNIYDDGRIDVRPSPQADKQTLINYLLGSALAAALTLQDIVLLHANAVLINGQAILVMGASGAGKSTTAQAFQQLGYQVLTDDVCRIHIQENQIITYAGPNVLKLFEHLLPPMMIEPCTPINEMGKYTIPMTPPDASYAPIRAIFWLSPSQTDTLTIEPVMGANKLIALLSNLFRPQFIAPLNKERLFMQQCVHLAQHAGMYHIKRPHVSQTAQPMVKHILNMLSRGE